MRLVLVGDSQADGLRRSLAAAARRHGYELDEGRSYTRAGAGIEELTEHARAAGPADLAVVVSGGANDPASLVRSQTAYRDKLVTLVNTLRFAGVQSVVLVGPLPSDDADVQAQHEAARAVQGRGIPGSRWIDGEAIARWVPHPVNNATHWDAASYSRIGLELEKALFEQGTVTAIGLVGTLTFLGAAGVVLMEALYARAEG